MNVADIYTVHLFLYRSCTYNRGKRFGDQCSNAFFALIFAHFMIKSEKMTWKKSIGCLIGFAGVIVINLTPGGMAGGFQWMGEGLILVCSMAYGASSVTLKLLSGKETPTAITAFQLLFGG